MIGQQAIAAARKASPKFLPAVPEIEIACEEVAIPPRTTTYAIDWELRSKLQLEDRANWEAKPRPSKEFMNRMRDELKAHGIYALGAKPDGSKPSIAEFRSKYGITDEVWNSIPSQPKNEGYWRGIRNDADLEWFYAHNTETP
jgi:hypothetical protein